MRRVALLLCVLMLAPVTSAWSGAGLSPEDEKEIVGIEAEPKVLIIGIDGDEAMLQRRSQKNIQGHSGKSKTRVRGLSMQARGRCQIQQPDGRVC